MSFSLIFDLLLGGLILGGLYALIAVGLGLQYGVARVLNVSHGEFIMLGAFGAYSLHTLAGLNPILSLVISGPFIFLIAFGLHRTLFRYLRKTSSTQAAFEGNSLLASFGLMFVIQNIALLVGLSSLRLRGMYFTIFTFGLSELIRHTVLWWEVNISGTVGRLVVSLDHQTVYYILLVTVLLNLVLVHLIRRSKYGLALRGIGESEEAADHIGINVNRVKIGVFALSTFFMGTTGAVMATQWTYIDPSIAFNPLYSFMPVLMAIFGGITKVYGQLLGVVVLTLLADLLLTKFPYYYNLLYGIILVGVILFLPQGLAGLAVELKKWRERRSPA